MNEPKTQKKIIRIELSEGAAATIIMVAVLTMLTLITIFGGK